MKALLSLLPSGVMLVAVLGFRTSGLTAAMATAASALALWALSAFSPFSITQGFAALADAGVLTALVAAMVVPGIVFVEATRGRKSPEAIGAVVTAVGLPPAQTAILVAVGIGVLIESLTGMGVSLLVTMPLLLGLFERRVAIAVGLVGMCLMPWGALAISAHVGAQLSGVPLDTLQSYISVFSGPVAFCLPFWCLVFVPQRTAVDLLIALAAAIVLVAAIASASRFIGIEVAGVAGGLAVIATMIVLARSRDGLGPALLSPGLVPYGVLLAAVLVQKLAIKPLAEIGIAPVLATSRVTFAILTSPGVALLAATLISERRHLNRALAQRIKARAWQPIAAIALFLFAARLLAECGAMAALAEGFKFAGTATSIAAVVALGALGGFVTGSGVTGNALFMENAVSIAASVANGLAEPNVKAALPAIYAALQNSSAGHAAMAALPVGSILIATLGSRQPGDEARVMRIALTLAVCHLAVLTAIAALLLEARWPWAVAAWLGFR
ncbi:MAG: L-lactate permease [Hyphomicrobiaceae bacterium]